LNKENKYFNIVDNLIMGKVDKAPKNIKLSQINFKVILVVVIKKNKNINGIHINAMFLKFLKLSENGPN